MFDNLNDPLQEKNLIGQSEYNNTAERMRHKLRKKMEELHDTFEECAWYGDHWTDGQRNILRGAKDEGRLMPSDLNMDNS